MMRNDSPRRRPLRAPSEARRARLARLSAERLEERTLLSTFTVTNTLDAGAGSLRQALLDANATPNVGGPDRIEFALPANDPNHVYYQDNGAPGVARGSLAVTTAASDAALPTSGPGAVDAAWAHSFWRIRPASPLPAITDPVVVDGYSQAGAAKNNSATGLNTVLRIEIDGQAGAGYSTFIVSAGGSTIAGLSIHGFGFGAFNQGNGVLLQNGGGNRVQGNFIGTDVSGTLGLAPPGQADVNVLFTGEPYGVHVWNGSANNVIGSDGDSSGELAERNLISGNNWGIVLRGPAHDNVVRGNLIGTDRTGSVALANFAGIGTGGGNLNDRIEGNVLSGNKVGIATGAGPEPATIGMKVYGNLIGTDATGTQPLPNVGAGLLVGMASYDWEIGGTGPGQGNTIAHNGGQAGLGPGIWISDFRGSVRGIRVRGNAIYGNVGLGIELGGDYPFDGPNGVNPPTTPEGIGANKGQHAPALQSAQGGPVTSLAGTLTSSNPGPFFIDVYASPAATLLTPGQGARYLGSITLASAGAFTADLVALTDPGEVITATATDSQGNTSEFSAGVEAGAATAQGLENVLASGGSVTLAPTTTDALAATLAAIADLPTTTTGTIVVDLGGGATYRQVDSGGNTVPLIASAPEGTTLTIRSSTGSATVYDLQAAGGNIDIHGTPSGGITVVGTSPALVVTAGVVNVGGGVTFITATDSPTVIVTGGLLRMRGATVQESTAFTQTALLVTGGSVDLGTAADPGGNTINVNGPGTLVVNTSGQPVRAVGTDFTINGGSPSSALSGTVFVDFNNDGEVDFGENGLVAVGVTLDGVDMLGAAVHLERTTDGDGAYIFADLLPGTYRIVESQPAGYTQGKNVVGTAGGVATLDRFDLALGAALNALNYNFGERPPATGAVGRGQTAGIGFWNNRNGQDLIRSLNGGPTSTQLGRWLAATLPNTFGAAAGTSNLAGKTNAGVAAFFQDRFVVKGEKLDAQLLATALAVYVTNATLNSTGVGASYGFLVAGLGVGTATVNVGTSGDAFGVADGTVMTVMDLLLAADAQAVNGVLYNGNAARRTRANKVFSAINQAGNL